MIDAFLALMVMEGLVKPIALWIFRRMMRRLDEQIALVPDFLYEDDHGTPCTAHEPDTVETPRRP